MERVLPSQVHAFSKAIVKKLQARSSGFARDYLRAVVDEVVIRQDTATISGSNAKLVRAVASKKPPTDQVPSFIQDWRARKEKLRTLYSKF